MNASSQDANQTLEYRTATAIARLLPTGLLMIFLGLLIFVLADPAPIGTIIGVVLCLVVGSALVGLALWRRINHGKPLFTLSPDGIHYRIPWVKAFNIPWTEIQGVDSIDVETGYWSFWNMRHGFSILPDYKVATYYNVTVVLVPKQFYDQRMFVASFFLRGPGWRASFIPKGSLVQVALHHDLVSIEPRLLREAVEARWLAFRDRPGKTSVPGVTPGLKNATAAPKRPAARAASRDGRRCDGRRPESGVAVAGRSEHSASGRYHRHAGQSRRTLGFAGAERGARSSNQGARGTERLGGIDPAEQGRKQEARGGAERVAKAARRGYAPHVQPIVVGVAAAAEYAVRCGKDCCDLTG